MLRFELFIDLQMIRANHVRVPELNPFFCESRCKALKIANLRFEAIRSNRSNAMKTWAFLRIDSHEPPRFTKTGSTPTPWETEIQTMVEDHGLQTMD